MAHQKAVELRRQSAKYTIPGRCIEILLLFLKPRLKTSANLSCIESLREPVSHEWIYRYMARDKCNGGKLYRHLGQEMLYHRGKAEQVAAIKTPYPLIKAP